MKNIFKKAVLGFSLLLAVAMGAKAQAESICNKFDPLPSPLSSQWIPCPTAPNVAVSTSNVDSIGGATDYYLKTVDESNASAVCTAPTNPMLGDWSKFGKCSEFCFDAQAFDNYDSTLRTMQINIFSGTKYFSFVFNKPADLMSADHKWHHFCVPIHTIAGSDPLPSTGQGIWAPGAGTVAGDWNSVLSNVTQIALPVDLTANASEVMGYDNLCLNGGTCGNDAVLKTFTKTAKRDCDKITYTIHVDVVSDGAAPLPITISDNWPVGVLPATSVSISGTPAVTATTNLSATGWTMTFSTASGTGSVNGSYDIIFKTQIDPAALTGGDFKITNQASISLGYNGQPSKSDDPSVSGQTDQTTITVPAKEVKDCKNPPPPSCLSGKAEVTCGKIPGTYNIIIHPNGVGGVIPTSVTITPITPGITLSPAQLNYPVIGGQVQVTVVGATLGQVIEFDVSGTTAGGGSASGSDLCCNGIIKIEIPRDLPCKDLIPVDLAIKKTGGTSPAPGVPDYAFHLAITNEGPAYTAAIGMLTVTDVVPAGMKFTTVTPPAGWSCSPNTNVPAGTTITCHNTIVMNLPAGPGAALGTINIAALALGNMPFPDFTNCSDVALEPASGATDSVPPNNHSCVTVSKKPKTHVEIQKTCEPAKLGKGDVVAPKWQAICHIKVTTTGVITQPISISESFNGTGSVNYVSSTDPWACSPSSSTMPIPLNCTLPANTLTGPTNVSIIDVKVTFPNMPPIKPITNCASGTYNHHSIDPSCVPIIVEQKSTIKINKICDPVTEVVGAINHFEAKCHITVTTTGPQSGAIVVSEAMTNGAVISATAPAPWACTTANCNINGSLLNQTSSTSVIDVVVKINQGETKARNCARLSQTGGNPIESCADIVTDPKTGTLTVVKNAFDYFGKHITTVNFPANVTCGAVVTPITVADGTPYVQSGIPLGTNCTVVEQFTNPPTGACPQGQNTGWVTTYNPNTPVVITATGATITITNKVVCEGAVPRDMFVKKVVVNHAPLPLTGMVYDITSQCTNTTQPTGFAHFADGQTVLFHHYEVGMTCNLSEVIPTPTTACGKDTPVWTTTYSQANPVVLSPNGETITVTNTLDCKRVDTPIDSQLYVKKVVVNHAPGSVAGLQFWIEDNCNSNQNHGQAYLKDGDVVHYKLYEAGVSCQIYENNYPPTTACGADTPVWSTTYSPSQTVALQPNGETVTVTNTLDCKPVVTPVDGNPIKVKKVVINNAPLPIDPSLQFPITVTCVKGNNGEVLDNDATHTVADGQTVDYLPYAAGFSCSAHEGAIPQTNACGKQTPVWTTTYATQPVAMTPAGETITVTNTLNCEQTPVPTIAGFYIKKLAYYNGVPILDIPFKFSHKCGSVIWYQGISHGGSTGDNNFPVGSTCSTTEGTLPTTTICPPDQAAHWTTTYSPSQSLVLTSAGATITVTNILECRPKINIDKTLKCDTKTSKLAGQACRCTIQGMVPVSKTACACQDGSTLHGGVCRKDPPPPPVCRNGTHLEGKQCVENAVNCRPPSLRNPNTNTCFVPPPKCGPGTHLVGKRCVPNDVICRAPSKRNPKTNTCVVPEQKCEPGTHKQGRNCVPDQRKCGRGEISVKGRCISIPRCAFPEIPVPGTGICINPFGGGGGPKNTDGVPPRP